MMIIIVSTKINALMPEKVSLTYCAIINGVFYRRYVAERGFSTREVVHPRGEFKCLRAGGGENDVTEWRAHTIFIMIFYCL